MDTPRFDPPNGSTIPVRGFVLDLRRRELRTPAGELAVLRPKALELLLALGEQAGHVVSKDALIERVWPQVVVTEDSLTQLVNEIRRLIGDAERQIVRTVPRRGYLLSSEPSTAASPPTSASTPTNLPSAQTVLYGRERDLAACDALLREHRLVTLTGPGGIGKTRLALAAGLAALPRFPHGVWLIDLAARRDRADVLPAIATAAGIEPAHGDTLGRLLAELSAREALLVLDNCEHLAQEVAAVVTAILASTSRVRILATSQAPLRVPGEALQRLDVLAVPPEDLDSAAATRFGAFELFIDRVREAGVDAELDARATAAAIDICRRLDGVPLALEMAAARVPALGMGGVRDRLDVRLRLLRTARLQVPSRHETLRATLEWSCSLLEAPEALALRRLAVFSGQFDVDVARQVIAADDLDEWTALDALCGLVDKSLVRTEGFDPVRYRLLETTRLYALEQLAASGEMDATLDRHARAMSEYSRLFPRIYNSFDDDEVVSRCGIYLGDLDRALERLVARGDSDMAASTLLGLRWIAHMAGDQVSMEPRLKLVHGLMTTADGVAKARLLTIFASCGWLTINGLRPLDSAQAAVDLWRTLQPHPSSLSHALLLLATGCALEGRAEEAYAALNEAVSLTAPLELPKRHLVSTMQAGQVALYCGDAAAALEAMQSALALARSLRASRSSYYIQAFLPEAAMMAGDTSLAVSMASQAVSELRSFGQGYLANAWECLVLALLHGGDFERARSEAASALPLAWAFGFDNKIAATLALLAARTGQHAMAAELLGYVMPRLLPLRNAVDRWRYRQCEALRAELEPVVGAQPLADTMTAAAALDGDAAFELAARVIQ